MACYPVAIACTRKKTKASSSSEHGNSFSLPLTANTASIKKKEFRYDVSGVTERYLRFSLISAVDFYYVINKLIILVPDPH
jgi:hypothetical protein